MSDVAQIIADIEAWLDKATPGPWVAVNGMLTFRVSAAVGDVAAADEPEARYIAACSPDRIRALLDEVKRKDEERARILKALMEAGERRIAAEAELARLWTLIDGHDPDNPDDGPRCRDCADNFGICENTGLPCDPQKAAEEKVKRLHARLRAPAGDVGEVVRRL